MFNDSWVRVYNGNDDQQLWSRTLTPVHTLLCIDDPLTGRSYELDYLPGHTRARMYTINDYDTPPTILYGYTMNGTLQLKEWLSALADLFELLTPGYITTDDGVALLTLLALEP